MGSVERAERATADRESETSTDVGERPRCDARGGRDSTSPRPSRESAPTRRKRAGPCPSRDETKRAYLNGTFESKGMRGER